MHVELPRLTVTYDKVKITSVTSALKDNDNVYENKL